MIEHNDKYIVKDFDSLKSLLDAATTPEDVFNILVSNGWSAPLRQVLIGDDAGFSADLLFSGDYDDWRGANGYSFRVFYRFDHRRHTIGEYEGDIRDGYKPTITIVADGNPQGNSIPRTYERTM